MVERDDPPAVPALDHHVGSRFVQRLDFAPAQQARPVGLDGEKVVPTRSNDVLGGGVLTAHRVCSDHAVGQIELVEQAS